jgi:mycofactocin system glycosyltransferase
VTVPLPQGWTVVADRATRWSADGTCVYGGSPWRMLRLTGEGAALTRRLLAGATVDDVASAAMARRLTDSGLAHPVPPAGAAVDPVDVVVPAYGRPAELDDCLATLGRVHPVVVVDDASPDPTRVAAVAGNHAARLHRLDTNQGPAAARNAGAATTAAPVIAFVDSDVTVDADTLTDLARHLLDPTVGAVAPRIVPVTEPTTALARFAEAASPLDLGGQPATVRPHLRVAYVPSTVLLVRRAVFDAVGGFDEALRYGEDVDLVWRLVDAGWTVRYDPTCIARHHEPTRWSVWTRRRFHYGASAGPLAVRHGSRLSGPAPAALVAPLTIRRSMRDVLPPDVARDLSAVAAKAALSGLARWAGPLLAPPLLGAAAVCRSLPLAAAAAGMAATAGAVDVAQRTGRMPSPRLMPAAALDGLAYGTGVWWGALRARTSAPLLPRTGGPDVSS